MKQEPPISTPNYRRYSLTRSHSPYSSPTPTTHHSMRKDRSFKVAQLLKEEPLGYTDLQLPPPVIRSDSQDSFDDVNGPDREVWNLLFGYDTYVIKWKELIKKT